MTAPESLAKRDKSPQNLVYEEAAEVLAANNLEPIVTVNLKEDSV